jgi:hypothetical protein
VVVSVWPVPETIEASTNRTDDIEYPCAVFAQAAKNQDLTLTEGELRWRRQIRDAFRYQRPASLAAAIDVPLIWTRWQPLPVLDVQEFVGNKIVSGCVVWVKTREVR